jgi:hypothetical protein
MTKVCNISVGRDGNEWVGILTFPTGKVTELRDTVLEEVLFGIAREMEGVE